MTYHECIVLIDYTNNIIYKYHVNHEVFNVAYFTNYVNEQNEC